MELCTSSTTMGDFGLCDEVRLESTTDTIVVAGPVTLGTPMPVKTLKGDCHALGGTARASQLDLKLRGDARAVEIEIRNSRQRLG